MKTYLKHSAVMIGALASTSVLASTDYPPAVYRPMSGCTKWYSSGNGHKFVICHDMEGYYASTISYLNRCDVSVSIHYMVNGKQDTSTDYAAGQIDQQVREAYYAWHARCWNTYSYGTEHEGFASNPAWYTEAMYKATAGLQEHLCDAHGIAKDRNHIVGHNAWQSSAWRSYASANFGIDPNCNTHTDPGPYWDWAHLMDLINPPAPPVAVVKSGTRVTGDFNGDGKEDVVVAYDYGGGTTKLWMFLSTGSAFSAPAVWWASGTGSFDSTKAQYIAGDFNGDGKTDVAALYDYGSSTSKIWIWTSNGSGFNVPSVWWASDPGNWNAQRAEMFTGDFNGDGKSDIGMAYDYGSSTTHIWAWLSTGTGFSAPGVWWESEDGSFNSLKATYLGGDFDGDGKGDVVAVYDYGNSTTKYWKWTSTGSAFVTPTVWFTSTTWNSANAKYFAGDYNGDGKMDMAAAYDYGNRTVKFWEWSSTGTAFGASAIWYTSTTWDSSLAKYVAGDFNGSGKSGVSALYDYGSGVSKLWTWLSSGSAFTSDSIWWASSGSWTASRSTPF